MLLSLYDMIYTETGELTPYGAFWIFRVAPDCSGAPGTGRAWRNRKGTHPFAFFDPDADRVIPIDWSDWLGVDGTNSTYASHILITSPELAATDLLVENGVIQIRVAAAPGSTLVLGNEYFITCRITAANGETQDKTLFLRIRAM